MKTDGTPEGTQLLQQNIKATEMAAVGSRIILGGDYIEPWFSDGTPAGTAVLKDIKPGTYWSGPKELTAFHDIVLFTADDGVHGRELWRSNGTEDGTVPVKDITPGNSSIRPQSLTVVGDWVYFAIGRELWKTDGTEAGTVPVKQIGSSTFATGPENLTAVGSTLFFTADDQLIGNELWKSDGTEAGTVPVKNFVGSSNPRELTAAGDILYFTASPQGFGSTELWKTNGTEAGTTRVKPDIWVSYDGQHYSGVAPHAFKALGDTLYFVADDGKTGLELWQSNGMDAGTVLAADINPGHGGSSPTDLIVDNGTLYFTADDGFHGKELWKVDVTGQTTEITAVTGLSLDPRTAALDYVDVTFSRQINPATFNVEDVFLERDGSRVFLTSDVTVRHVSGNTYRVEGLRRFSQDAGRYVLGIRGSGICDSSGQIVAGGAPTIAVDFVPATVVVDRHVFYNNSSWDGNNAAANASDDAAIATDKTALLPGGMASLANYTSFSKGINGIILDVANLGSTITAGDFAFKTGNVNDTATWTTLATAPSLSIRPGEGTSGSDRVTLTWPDGTIKKQWLQVTMRSNANTGLVADDVFYFGNAIGDAGNSATDAQVNAADELAARGNPRNLGNPAPITFLYDYNRDKQVNAADQLISRVNPTNLGSRLKLITPTVETAPAAALAEPVAHHGPAGALADAALVGLMDGEMPARERRGLRRA